MKPPFSFAGGTALEAELREAGFDALVGQLELPLAFDGIEQAVEAMQGDAGLAVSAPWARSYEDAFEYRYRAQAVGIRRSRAKAQRDGCYSVPEEEGHA